MSKRHLATDGKQTTESLRKCVKLSADDSSPPTPPLPQGWYRYRMIQNASLHSCAGFLFGRNLINAIIMFTLIDIDSLHLGVIRSGSDRNTQMISISRPLNPARLSRTTTRREWWMCHSTKTGKMWRVQTRAVHLGTKLKTTDNNSSKLARLM